MVTLLVRGIALLSLLVGLAVPAGAQDSKGVGVVTALTGRADLKRPQAPEASLKLRDNLFVRDVVDTRKESLARILLVGKSTVTVRELSRFEIREQVQPDGSQRAIIDLTAGKIRVMVARRLMRPGDEVQVRTPNAVASVRGSDGIFEVTTLSDGRPQTSVLVASGEFEMTLPATRPIAMAETRSDAAPGIWVAQAVFTIGPSQVSIVTGPPGLQSVVQRFADAVEVRGAVGSFAVPASATAAGQSAPNEAAILATGEALAQFETLRTGEQPAQTTTTTAPSPTTSETPVTTTESDVLTPITTTDVTTTTTTTETPTSTPPPPEEEECPAPCPPGHQKHPSKGKGKDIGKGHVKFDDPNTPLLQSGIISVLNSLRDQLHGRGRFCAQGACAGGQNLNNPGQSQGCLRGGGKKPGC